MNFTAHQHWYKILNVKNYTWRDNPGSWRTETPSKTPWHVLLLVTTEKIPTVMQDLAFLANYSALPVELYSSPTPCSFYMGF